MLWDFFRDKWYWLVKLKFCCIFWQQFHTIYYILRSLELLILSLLVIYFVVWCNLLQCTGCALNSFRRSEKFYRFYIITWIFPCSYEIGYSRACIASITRMESTEKGPCWEPVCPIDDVIHRPLQTRSSYPGQVT